MNYRQFFQSKKFNNILCSVGAVVITLLIFQAGIFVGYHKAGFSYRMGDNYYRAFGGERGGFMGMHQDRYFMNAHGVVGKIIKIDSQSIIVTGSDNVEKVVVTDDDTIIRHLRDSLAFADLKVGQNIVIIGSPDDKGQIVAKLIRLMDLK